MTTTSRKAVNRCEYSMTGWYLSGGNHLPKHLGQPGHPSPDPVARTSPPMAIKRTVKADARMASVRRPPGGGGAPSVRRLVVIAVLIPEARLN